MDVPPPNLYPWQLSIIANGLLVMIFVCNEHSCKLYNYAFMHGTLGYFLKTTYYVFFTTNEDMVMTLDRPLPSCPAGCDASPP